MARVFDPAMKLDDSAYDACQMTNDRRSDPAEISPTGHASPLHTAIVLLLLQDLSRRQQRERERNHTIAALQAQVERLGLALEFNQIGCWDWFIDEQKLVWDEQCFRLLGVAPTQTVTFELWKSLIHPSDFPEVEQHLAECIANQTDYSVEYRICLADGTIRWLQAMGRCLPSTAFPQRRMIGIAMDISDRKTAELLLQDVNTELNCRAQAQVQELQAAQATLQQREAELSSLLAHIPDIVTRVDRNLYCLYANAATTAISGLPTQALVGKHVTEVALPRPFLDLWVAKYQQVLATKETTLIYIDFPTNSGLRYFEGKIVPEFDAHGEVVSMLTICRDITSFKETEIALRRSEERFRKLFEVAPIAIGVARVSDQNTVQVNPAHIKLLGYTEAEIVSMTYPQYSHPTDMHLDQAWMVQLLAGTIPSFQMEKRFIRKDGTWFWSKLTVTLLHEGQDTYSMALMEDITEQKRAEAALRESEERFRTFFKDAPLPIGLSDARTCQILEANTAMQRWLGYTNEEFCTKTFYEITHPADVDGDLLLSKQLRIGEIDHFQLQKRFTKKTGEIVWADIHVKLIRDRHGDPLYNLCVAQDITLAKQLVEERDRAEDRLRSLLQEKDILLKEVHHRVKNNLQIISSLLRMQSRKVDESVQKLFQEAQSRVQSIAMIHEHLYQSSDLAHIAFADYIQTLIAYLFQSYGANPEQIQTDIHIQAINLDMSQAIACGLIVNELVSNSLKYAFADGRSGIINIYLNLNHDSSSTQKQGILIVEDNGVGIPADVDWQRSPSLGLRIIRAIAAQINGTITLNHRSGTSFQVSFTLTSL